MQPPFFFTFLYLKYIYHESFSWVVYLNALIIGLIIGFSSGSYTAVPFIVPVVVQIIARSSIKFKQRHKEALLELPGQKEDPVFIMQLDGRIMLSVGRTKELFDKYGINNVSEFLSREGLSKIRVLLENYQPGSKLPILELFSGITDKWYEIKAKPARFETVGMSEAVLVWMQDITLRKSFDQQLNDLLHFSSSMVLDQHELDDVQNVYRNLAAFILRDYEAIFIARTDAEGNLIGFVFKRDESDLKKSDEIKIVKESSAPIFISRRVAKIITDDIKNFKNEKDFLNKNPFDPQVIQFIGHSLRNFITYNEEDVSIIAFNYKANITSYEKQYIEVLLNMTRTILQLSDLAMK